MPRRPIVLAALFVLTSAVRTFAQPAAASAPPAPPTDDDVFIDADRPGFADTSTVIGRGWIQLETGIQGETRGVTGDRQRALYFPVLLRVGISRRVELRVEGNSFTRLTQPDSADAPADTGFAPFSAGFKWQWCDTDGVHRPGFGLIGRAFPRWGTGDLRAHRFTGDLRLASNWDLTSKVSLNPNIGVAWLEDGDNRFAAAVFAVTLAYAPAERASVFVDIGLLAPEAAGAGTGAVVDAGIAYFPAHDVQLDISAGTRAIGDTGPHPFVSAGISLRGHAWGRGHRGG